MQTASGGYRPDHLRALAQRIKVDAKEVRIMASKSVLPRTLVAASSAKRQVLARPVQVPKWARAEGLKPRDAAVQVVLIGALDLRGDDLADLERAAARQIDRTIDLRRVGL